MSPRRTAATALAIAAALLTAGVAWSHVAPSHPNGPIAFVGKGLRADDRDLFLLDPTTGATRNLTQTPETYEGSPAWSPDGSKVVFDRYAFKPIREGASRQIDHLVLMDLATGDRADPGWCESASCAQDVAWSPDGTHVALFDVVGGERVLRSIDVASGNGIDLCAEAVCGDGLGHPIWSPDGRWVAVSNVLRTRAIGPEPISGSVWLARSDGSSVQRLTPEDPSACPAESSNEGCPFDVAGSFSPDSSEVAFCRYDFSREDRQPTGAFIVSVATGQIRPLSPCEPDYCPQVIGPRWSPAGGWIASVAGSGEAGDRRYDRLGLTVARRLHVSELRWSRRARVVARRFMARRRRWLIDPAPRDPGRRSRPGLVRRPHRVVRADRLAAPVGPADGSLTSQDSGRNGHGRPPPRGGCYEIQDRRSRPVPMTSYPYRSGTTMYIRTVPHRSPHTDPPSTRRPSAS